MSREPTTVNYSVRDGVATLRIGRAHGNAINGTLVQDLTTTVQEAASDPEVRGLLLAADGKLFCPGLDLRELIELDRPAMERFMLRFSAMLLALYTLPKPVVAALSGHTLAGGCVIALTADRRVLVEGALVGLNEVIVGVPLPFGVCLILRETVRTPILEEVALIGRNYRGQEAVDSGLVHEIHGAEGFEGFCLERLAEFTEKDANAFATTKRYLRSAAVERIRANDRKFVPEFLDCWFSNDTQARIRGIVEQLAAPQKDAKKTE